VKENMSRVGSAGVTAARRLLQRLRRRPREGVAILGYHRVCGGPDPLRLSVSSEHFAQQLDVLARGAHPMPLREAAAALGQGALPHRAVVVTLDDGYADNLDCALPLLERYEVPATVFVVSGTRGGEFWWDRLVRALEGAKPRHASARRRATALARELEAAAPEEREKRLREIETENARAGDTPRHRSLTAEELVRLAAHPLIEIGSHTVSHRPLAMLPEDVQRDEIERSKIELEASVRSDITSFAYPHGSCSQETLTLVGAAGYSIACASTEEVASRGSTLLALPRLWPGNHDGRVFGRWLSGWIGK
jgi:peptidoglycan/xylan/chitin deacetylase (PgdA/CDA1 family)